MKNRSPDRSRLRVLLRSEVHATQECQAREVLLWSKRVRDRWRSCRAPSINALAWLQLLNTLRSRWSRRDAHERDKKAWCVLSAWTNSNHVFIARRVLRSNSLRAHNVMNRKAAKEVVRHACIMDGKWRSGEGERRTRGAAVLTLSNRPARGRGGEQTLSTCCRRVGSRLAAGC